MLPLLILIFIVVPIAELAVIIQVGGQIGVWWTIAILIADSIIGSLLMRSQGRASWRRFNVTLQSGRPPAREALDGVLVIFGGALLLTPGFITDFLGLIGQQERNRGQSGDQQDRHRPEAPLHELAPHVGDRAHRTPVIVAEVVGVTLALPAGGVALCSAPVGLAGVAPSTASAARCCSGRRSISPAPPCAQLPAGS